MKTKDYLIGKYYDGDTTAEEETTLRMTVSYTHLTLPTIA